MLPNGGAKTMQRIFDDELTCVCGNLLVFVLTSLADGQ